jgi:hypothetical protein
LTPENGTIPDTALILGEQQLSDQLINPRIQSIPEIVNRSVSGLDHRFNLKITDLSSIENPFVIFENRPTDAHGFLLL